MFSSFLGFRSNLAAVPGIPRFAPVFIMLLAPGKGLGVFQTVCRIMQSTRLV